MATQKKTAPKKPTTKKTSTKPQSRTPQRKPAQKENRSRQLSAEIVKQRNQVRAVILFTCAIFLGCVVLISGDNLWLWTHNVILGLFGNWAIIAPILMIYIAIITSLDRPRGSIGAKIWTTVIIILICCGMGYIFSRETVPNNLNWLEFIKNLFEHNVGVGGGVVGGLLGTILISATGTVGSRIIILLLLFVATMILTGTTLVQLFHAIRRPVKIAAQKVKDYRFSEPQIGMREEIEPDDAMPTLLPAHPVQSETAYKEWDDEEVFRTPSKKEKKKSSELFDQLKSIFGYGNRTAKTEADPCEEPDATTNNATTSQTRGEQTLEELIEQKRAKSAEKSNSHSGNGTEGEKNTAASLFPETQKTKIKSGKTAPLDQESADEAEKATERLLKKKKAIAELEQADKGQSYHDTVVSKDHYTFPPVTMLAEGKHANPVLETDELQTNGRILVETLKSFGVQSKILDICRGPSVTRYELQPAPGVKISKITNLSDDLAMNLAAMGVRIEAPIPGKAAVGIEIPNQTKTIVRMRELVESNAFLNAKSRLTVALGRDIAGQVTVADLSKMPHLLIAGTTGSGKSVCINSLIISTLYKATPDEVRFLMIDPKVVELGIYNGIPHLLVPVVTDPRKSAGALEWAVNEMLKRYKIFAECNVRDLEGYNTMAKTKGYEDENGQPMLRMPQIVIIIDELSDLMMAAPNEVEDAICRLAQMARAAGMHLVVATQRPSVDVVTGLIKANIPSRIAFAVSSAVDSRTILDGGGAEKLLGQGDMLFSPVGAQKPIRIQGCFVSDSEIESIVGIVKKTHDKDYDEDVILEIEKNATAEPSKKKNADANDEEADLLLNEAIKCVIEAGQASTSLLQRRLRVGYARAGRLVDEMEQRGIVGPHEGSKPRQVLMSYSHWLEMNMQKSDTDLG